jgi:hypothetical protein
LRVPFYKEAGTKWIFADNGHLLKGKTANCKTTEISSSKSEKTVPNVKKKTLWCCAGEKGAGAGAVSGKNASVLGTGCLKPKMPELLNNKNWLEKEMLGDVSIICKAWSIQPALITLNCRSHLFRSDRSAYIPVQPQRAFL